MTQSVGEATFALHCQAYGLEPVPEHQFCERRWRFDFAFIEQKLAVEVDGGTWIAGRHNRGSSIDADYDKLNEAAVLGWRVLRFTTDQVKTGQGIDTVMRALLK